MAGVPDLERMYQCGDVLANAKGLSYKAVSRDYVTNFLPTLSVNTFCHISAPGRI